MSLQASGSDVPFEQRSVDEQDELPKRIGNRLAQIGDKVVQKYYFESDTSGRGEEAGPSQANASLLAEESRSLLGNGASSGGVSWSPSGSDVPFEQISVDKQEELSKRIGNRLAQIGDKVVQKYYFESDTGGRGEEAGPSQANASLLAEESRSLLGNGASSGGVSWSPSDLNDAIGRRNRRTVDGVSRGRNQPIPTYVIRKVIYDRAYVTFQEAVQSLINRNSGMEEISQLALVFHLTKLACKLAKAFGSQGGSGAVVESDSEDSVQESEID